MWAKMQKEVHAFFVKFSADRVPTLAASLSFYAILSLAPLSVVILFAFSKLNPALLGRFVNEARALVGTSGANAIEASLNSARARPITGGLASLASFLVVLISASAMFGEARASLSIILRSPPPAKAGDYGFVRRTWGLLHDRLLSVFFALVFVFTMALSLVASALLSAAAQSIGFLRFELPISFAIYSPIFTLLLMYGVRKGLEFQDAARGGCVTGVLFILGKVLIGLYLGSSSIASSYGVAGSVVALLAWIYYAVLIVFSGAEIAWLLAKRRKRLERRPVPVHRLRRGA